MIKGLCCTNVYCKYNIESSNSCELNNVTYSSKGCQSFEKSIVYYYHLVWNHFSKTNFILENDLTDDLRIGLYYVMRTFHLGFSITNYAGSNIISLKASENGSPLSAKEVKALEMDKDEFYKVLDEYDRGIIPKIKTIEGEDQPFGWLSPTGEFIEGDWGEHNRIARSIIKKHHFTDEYNQLKKESGSIDYPESDFLQKEKGYALIHDPSMTHGYQVLNLRPFTKKQREFLYNYFMKIGDTLRAETYMVE